MDTYAGVRCRIIHSSFFQTISLSLSLSQIQISFISMNDKATVAKSKGDDDINSKVNKKMMVHFIWTINNGTLYLDYK